MKVQAESIHLNGHIIGFRPHTKVRVTLQNSIKHSGTERGKRIQILSPFEENKKMDKALPLGGKLFPSYVLGDSDLIRIEGDIDYKIPWSTLK